MKKNPISYKQFVISSQKYWFEITLVLLIGISALFYELRYVFSLSAREVMFLDKLQLLTLFPAIILGIRLIIIGKNLVAKSIGAFLVMEFIYIVTMIGLANAP